MHFRLSLDKKNAPRNELETQCTENYLLLKHICKEFRTEIREINRIAISMVLKLFHSCLDGSINIFFLYIHL